MIEISGADEVLIGTDLAKHHRILHVTIIDLQRLKLPHSIDVPHQQNIAGAAAGTEKVVPGNLIGVGNARIPDRRLHVLGGGEGERVHRQKDAAVAVGRGVGVDLCIEGEPLNRGPREIRADKVSGLVEALGPLNKIKVILPCDDEASVRKGSHVAGELLALLIEDVDENVALDEAATGIIDSRANV